jgi:hypothetical protein
MAITRAEQSAMTTGDQLPQMLEFHGGVLQWRVLQLRTLAGAKRSGARVLEGIEKELAAHNVGHLPPRIPSNQDAEILLYDLRAPAHRRARSDPEADCLDLLGTHRLLERLRSARWAGIPCGYPDLLVGAAGRQCRRRRFCSSSSAVTLVEVSSPSLT